MVDGYKDTQKRERGDLGSHHDIKRQEMDKVKKEAINIRKAGTISGLHSPSQDESVIVWLFSPP